MFFTKKVILRLVPVRLKNLTKDLNNRIVMSFHFRRVKKYFAGLSGLEIGGPSKLFSDKLPIYQTVKNLDNVNFASDTIWEESLTSYGEFKFRTEKSTGTQYISEATNLKEISDVTYDFLISSNCLEHIANPVKALIEWKRVIKPSGTMLVIVPRKESNFDHKRNTTKLAHIIEDFLADIGEESLTHLSEILSAHDLSRDPAAGTIEEFHNRSLANFENRSLHHHVFDSNLLSDLFLHIGFKVIYSFNTDSDYFCFGKSIS